MIKYFSKKVVGNAELVTGIILLVLGFRNNDVFITVAGATIALTGLGLIIIAYNDNETSTNDVNLYIGKKVFEKGLEAFVIEILIGSLSLIFGN